MIRLNNILSRFSLMFLSGFFLIFGSQGVPISSPGEKLEDFIEAYVSFRRNGIGGDLKTAQAWIRQADELREWRQQLGAISRDGLTLDQDIDYRLIASDIITEIARIERERRWEKDPGLYLRLENVASALKAGGLAPEEESKRLRDALLEIPANLSLAGRT